MPFNNRERVMFHPMLPVPPVTTAVLPFKLIINDCYQFAHSYTTTTT